jgi:hypothetical protein
MKERLSKKKNPNTSMYYPTGDPMTYDKHDDEFVEMDFTEEVPGMDDTTFWQLCYLVAMLRSKKFNDRAEPEHIAWDAVRDLKKFRELKHELN